MEKEFNLSEKSQCCRFYEDDFVDCYLEEDVKEFIERLKDEVNNSSESEFPSRATPFLWKTINRLAGDKLINKEKD